MFVVASFEDSVRALPADLGHTTLDAVTAVLEKTYIDKVIRDVGLVVTIFDVLDIEGGFIYHSDGAAHFLVKFRLVVFRPLVGEILNGRLARCDKTGIWVSLEFFKDVFIPAYSLQEPSRFDTEEQLWFWDYEGNTLFMDLEEPVRLRVKDVKFLLVPTPAQLKLQGEETLGTLAQPFAPMEVIGAMDDSGLGCLSWWNSGEDAMEE